MSPVHPVSLQTGRPLFQTLQHAGEGPKDLYTLLIISSVNTSHQHWVGGVVVYHVEADLLLEALVCSLASTR